MALALSALACSGQPSSEHVASRRHPIVGGEETPECGWPTAVHFVASLGGNTQAECTATLVHPKMITIAAHCVDEGTPEEIFFGDTRDHDGPGRSVRIEHCEEKGGQQAGEDFAYCILEEEVNDVSIIPILYGCELQQLQEGEQVALVGFGNIDEDTPSPGGHKRWVEAPVVELDEKTIDLGESGHSNCFGDSGGPAYFQLADGSWRVFGATSTSYVVNDVACAHEGTWAFTPYYVPWIEESSGLDVTPCYDADGSWNPGPDCGGVPKNPEQSTGTWAQMCRQTEQLSGFLSTCGEPYEPPSTGGTGGAGGSAGASGSAGMAGASGATLGGAGGGAGSAGTGGVAGAAFAGAAPTSSGAGGVAGSSFGGSGGSSGSGQVPLGVATSSTEQVEGGCACRAPAGRGGSPGGLALLGLALAAFYRRRWR